MKTAVTALAITCLAVAFGCESNAPTAASTSADGTAAPPPPMPATPGDPGGPADQPAAAAASPAPGAAAASKPASGAAPAAGNDLKAALSNLPAAGAPDANAGSTEKAAVGVGAKGRDYGGPGFVTTPVQTMFRAEQRIAFEAQIPNAMKLYKAEHNNKGPKTQEEYMNIIIKENGVQLPDLPDGDTYFYDPKTEELMVRHPAPQTQPPQ